MKIPTINSIAIFFNSKIDPERKMKKTRHFVGNCIRLFRKSKEVLKYYFYRKIILPLKFLLKKYFPALIYIRTSGSDIKSYKEVCLLAAKDDFVFNTFRRHKDYAHIVGEGGEEEVCRAALDIIQRDCPDLAKYSKKFEESEKYGNPVIHKYDFGEFSNTTIKCIKVLCQFKNIFGSLDGYDIIEIGGAYGSQCKIISDVFNFRSYTLVDLAEVLPLVQKYLTKLKVQNVFYLPPDKISNNGIYDLIISNSAFAECERFIQDDYIDKILKRVKRGFIIYNSDTHPSQKYDPVRPYYRKEIIQILSKYHNLKIFEDYRHYSFSSPFYHNPIIVWDDTSIV